MNEKIFEMIEKYGDDTDFYGKVSEKDISKIEEMLNLQFPHGVNLLRILALVEFAEWK